MQYCPTVHCPGRITFPDTLAFCEACETELVPEIRCRCGAGSFNPKWPQARCLACQTAWTDTYLAHCMQTQLAAMVYRIAQAKAL